MNNKNKNKTILTKILLFSLLVAFVLVMSLCSYVYAAKSSGGEGGGFKDGPSGDSSGSSDKGGSGGDGFGGGSDNKGDSHKGDLGCGSVGRVGCRGSSGGGFFVST